MPISKVTEGIGHLALASFRSSAPARIRTPRHIPHLITRHSESGCSIFPSMRNTPYPGLTHLFSRL